MFSYSYVDRKFDYPPYVGGRIYYLICGAPRVGSTLLCDLLHGSAAMGAPAEYFHPELGIRPLAGRLGLLHNGRVDLGAYVEGLKSIRTAPNGVFGVKVQYWMVAPLVQKKIISKHLPNARFIYLTRSDPVAQGVSFDLARQSGQWTSLHPGGEATFNKARIMEAIRFVLNDQMSWEVFFSLNDINPYRVTYDRLVQETEPVCKEICEYVGVTTDHRFSLDKARIKRQQERMNEQWIERLKESAGY